MSVKDESVVIVGGGPVGLTLALLLARQGIEVDLLEAEDNIIEELRASTFHPPTLDMLDELGITPALIARGLVTPTWQVRMHATGEAAVFDLGILRDETVHPYRLQCEQHILSQEVAKALANYPCARIHHSTRVASVGQDADHAFAATDSGETFTARYLVGCDGAKSIVRSTLGFKLEGETYPETMILATTRFDFATVMPGLSNVNYIWTDHPAMNATFSLLRVPGRWRSSLYPSPDETVEMAITPDALQRKMQAIYPRDEPYEIMEYRPYRIHQRIVEKYRVGRLVLAGDSAHINSPSGGMGMNGGIHDAFSLCDKLVRIFRGEDEALLDLYSRQRQPVARDQILSQADKNRKRMWERDPVQRRKHLDDLKRIADDKAACLAHCRKTSMIEGLEQSRRIP